LTEEGKMCRSEMKKVAGGKSVARENRGGKGS